MVANVLMNMMRRLPRSNAMRYLPDRISSELLRAATRRHFFRQSGFGIGAAALTGLFNDSLFAAAETGADESDWPPKPPMFPAKAKSVIYLFMAGAPSQVDLLDPKPMLQKYDGQNVPAGIDEGRALRLHQGHAEAAGLAVRV